MRSVTGAVHDLGATGNSDLLWALRLRKLLAEGHYDIVHFHLPYSAAIGRLIVRSLPKRSRPAVVYTEHSLWPETATPIRILNRATIGLDDGLIAVSDASRRALPTPLRERAEVIVHGIDLSAAPEMLRRKEEIRSSVRSEFGLEDDELLVLTVANLRAEKGYDVLLTAADDLVRRSVPVRFVTAGQGELETEMKARHRELGLGGRFVFCGPRSDVMRLMTGSDIFALPSHHEGLPVTLMEASSVGLPIVATSVGEIPAIFQDGESALLVPPGKPDLLAQALDRAISDESLRSRLGKGALAESVRFDVATAARRVEELYREILARKDH
jgi:glycosyltransferase involved in cell wall biosynthesis